MGEGGGGVGVGGLTSKARDVALLKGKKTHTVPQKKVSARYGRSKQELGKLFTNLFGFLSHKPGGKGKGKWTNRTSWPKRARRGGGGGNRSEGGVVTVRIETCFSEQEKKLGSRESHLLWRGRWGVGVYLNKD